MSRKTAGGLLGTMIAAGVAAGIAKYLKDYAGASYTKADELERVKKNSDEVKNAAKRTYIAIKEKGNVKDAAGELLEAAGNVVTDAGSIAKTAGTGVYHAAKEIKNRYDEDPAAARDEMVNNLKDMGQELMGMAADAADSVVSKFAKNDEADDADASESSCGCEPYSEAKAFESDEYQDTEEKSEACTADGMSCEAAEAKENEAVSDNAEPETDQDAKPEESGKIEIESDEDSGSSIEISDEG